MKKRPVVVMAVGKTHSGKSTFAQNLAQKLPNFLILNSDPIELFLKKNYPSFYGFDTTPTDNYSHQELRASILRTVLLFGLANGLDCILANANLTRETRRRTMKVARKARAKVVIVYFNLLTDTLSDRIRVAKKSKSVLTESKDFEILLKKQTRLFEPPIPDESDYFIEINETTDTSKVIEKIKSFNNVR